MDRLIWDIDTLQGMASRLRLASEQLLDCKGELKLICASGEELFKSNDGVSRRVLEQTESLIYRTERAGEKCSELTVALLRVIAMMTAAETSLQKMALELPAGPEKSMPELPWPRIPFRPGVIPIPWRAPKYIVLANTSSFSIVPAWLSQAADSAFRA